jgi:hypothetical protein
MYKKNSLFRGIPKRHFRKHPTNGDHSMKLKDGQLELLDIGTQSTNVLVPLHYKYEAL